MSLLENFSFHEFFRNKEMNNFYLAVAIMTFAEDLISIFIPIYLFKLDYPIYSILIFYFLMALWFVIFSYPGAKTVARTGIKRSMVISVLILILCYTGLAALKRNPILFFVLPLLFSWRMIFYNYSYHLNYIIHSNRKKRGAEVSFLAAMTILVNVLAPLIGGIIALYAGFLALYATGALLLLIGTLPLSLHNERFEKLKFTQNDLWKEIMARKGTLISFSGYAVESIIGRTIWPVFLISIVVTTARTGLIVTLSMLASLLIVYYSGKITDTYDRQRLLKFGTVLYFFAWIGRIFAGTFLKIFIVDSYKNIAEKIIHIPWTAKSYDLAMRRGYFRFIVGREIIYNISRVIIMPILILIFYVDINPFSLSFAIAALCSLGYFFLEER